MARIARVVVALAALATLLYAIGAITPGQYVMGAYGCGCMVTRQVHRPLLPGEVPADHLAYLADRGGWIRRRDSRQPGPTRPGQ
jgi:hypothetical protein